MRILFWNLNTQNLTAAIKEIISEYDIDICGFAESKEIIDKEIILSGYRPVQLNSKIKVFSRISKDILYPKHEANRYVFLKFMSPVNGDFNILFCHLVDRINFKSGMSRGVEAINFNSEIKKFEQEEKCEKTIILGDFNINPFEIAMTGAGYLNATNDPIIAKKGYRTIQGKEYKNFYNPMWKLYSNINRPYGTYFLPNPNHDETHWNILDNVLLRPEVLPFLHEENELILQRCQNIELIKSNGIINKKYSDHLPIYIEINI